MRVLVCDDNADIREMLTFVLEGDGHEVEAVGNGRLLLERVKARRPDLILLDLRMPGIDGFEVLKALHAGGGSPPPVVAISAKTLEEDRRAALAAGASRYLLKPFGIGELLDTVRSFG
ncbi:MAG: response regulator [Acidobacteriota bacterium]